VLGLVPHETRDEYSSWLLPAVNRVLKETGIRMCEVNGYAVAAGPGSFTDVRVGVTTVKAWIEVYGKPVAAVSRLETIGKQVIGPADHVAPFVDAQRGQVFGAIYRRESAELTRLGEEMVIAPAGFVQVAEEIAIGQKIAWISPDSALVEADAAWKRREGRGESIEDASPILAGIIGKIGLQRLRDGKATDALGLDANYVRRSDAEIFWKGAAHGH